MEKFIRKLRRELTRNPKKTALLGGGLLIAVYFWAPLISKWTSNGETPPAESAESPAAVASETPEPATAPKGDLAVIPDWREFARQIESNQLQDLAALATPVRDPFFSSTVEIAKADARREAEAPETREPAEIVPPRTLADLNLKVEAILLRGRTRVAIVGGRIYREGDKIIVAADADVAATSNVGEEDNGFAPEVAEIHAGYVVLRQGEETLRLELERPTLAPGERITPVSINK